MLRRTKLLWLNYPNNPTGAVAGREFFERAVAWAREHQILICHDAAYSEIAFDGFRPPSILEVDGAKDAAIAALSEPVASDLIAVYQQRRDGCGTAQRLGVERGTAEGGDLYLGSSTFWVQFTGVRRARV